ncbi:hypothetical protein HOY80DRAFT_976883 [Tuber brumale]|nr:hypothetical protein HOY80DRAFT_976883 [Tuber brumale]
MIMASCYATKSSFFFIIERDLFMLVVFFPFFPPFPADHELYRDVGGDNGKRGLCLWPFDTAHFGRGQSIIQLMPCGFCTYSSVLYSTYIPSSLAAFTFSGSCILNPWFLGSFSFICSRLLFIYLLPSIFSDLSVFLLLVFHPFWIGIRLLVHRFFLIPSA